MATFRIPKHMVRSGVAMPAQPLRAWRSHPTYGNGLSARLILDRCDRLFESLVFAGYHPVAIYVQPGADLPGETLAFENLEHLGFSIEHFDWTEKTGLPAPTGTNTLAVAVVVDERMRYIGAGPTFAVPIPSIANLPPIQDDTNASVIFTSSLSRASIGDHAVSGPILRAVQVEARPFDPTPSLGRQTAALEFGLKAVSASVYTDMIPVAQAMGTWYQAAFDIPQPGLLPAFIGPRWRFAKPWIEDADLKTITDFGAELYAAIDTGGLGVGILLVDQLLSQLSVGELLARCRKLPVPPPAAKQLTEALIGRLCTLNGQHYPTTGGPLDAVDQQTCFRMLLLAHELGIVDVLGSSPATTTIADVADVRAASISFDVTGRYESRWAWAGLDTFQPDWIGCLQVNHVGHAVNGWWQTRAWRDKNAGEITPVQRPFVAALHDVDDEQRPILRFSLDDGATWHGLMTFNLDDTDGTDIVGLHVEYGTVTIGSNEVGAVDIPDGICTMWDYEQIDTKPYVHDAALESMPPAVAERVIPLERTPLHLFEREQLDAALDRLLIQIQSWDDLSAGPAKTGMVAQADHDIGVAYAPYLDPLDADALLVPARNLFIERLLTGVVLVDDREYTAYLRAVMMASAYAQQASHLRALLGLGTGQAAGANTYTYVWHVDMGGISGDIVAGGGGFLGTMTITKRTATEQLWSHTYGMLLLEYSKGLSAGVLFTKVTGGSIETVADWQPANFNGAFSMWGVESGAIFVRYGWTGEMTFFGNGQALPLVGPANGWNWAIGAYGAVAELGGAAGAIMLGARPEDVQLTTTVRDDYAIQHAVLGDWVGAEACFDVNSSHIRPEVVPRFEQMLCDHLAAFMDANGRIAIDGNASATGPDSVNDPLSVRRAQAACEAIRILLGGRLLIPEERIEMVGYGESMAPGGPDGPEVESARRVDVFMDADLMIGYR
jgi:hypothetical protein